MKFIFLLAAVSGSVVASVNCFIVGNPPPPAAAARCKANTKRPIGEGAGYPLSSPTTNQNSPLPQHFSTTSTALFGKVWDRLGIEPDTRKRWYILNCIAFTEQDCLSQCRAVCAAMPKSDVEKLVVPTQKVAKSRGNKNIIEDVSLYPGYVFAKVRLCPEVYEKLQGLACVRSWMGTIRKKGYKIQPSIPTPLQKHEVEQFQGLEEAMEQEEQQLKTVTKSLLDEYNGLEIGGMVKVKQGLHKNEDGIVKRLKDGKACVRMYTYGTQFDEWLDPTDLRPLTEEEVRKGIQGPERPINQERFNEEMGLPPPRGRGTTRGAREAGRGSLRSNLMGSMGGGGRQRNRRQDRVARGDKFKANAESQARKERQYWEDYQGEQRKRKQSAGQAQRPRRNQQGRGEVVGNEYDVGSQWGKRPKKQPSDEERALSDDEDWSAFMGSDDAGDDDDDDFFDDLLSELSGVIDENPPGADSKQTPSARSSAGTSLTSGSGSTSEEDSFFDSLEQELSSSSTGEAQAVAADMSGDEDDFFARLEQEMGGSANRDDSQTSMPSSDEEFFGSLEDEINAEADAPLVQDDPSSLGDDHSGDALSEDDFFDSLEEELAGANEGTEAESATPVATSDEDDLFAGLEAHLEADLADVSMGSKDVKESGVQSEVQVKKKGKASQQPKHDSSSKGDELASLTVPVLKERLRERGLKVSGRKAELIERLLSS